MVSGGLESGLDIKTVEEVCIVVVRGVIVPGPSVAVDEDGARGGDGVVVVYQEGEVGHGLVGAVCGDAEGVGLVIFVGRGVDVVDAEVVFFGEGRGGEPGSVAVGFYVGDDEGGFRGFREARTAPARVGERVGAGLVADFSP